MKIDELDFSLASQAELEAIIDDSKRLVQYMILLRSTKKNLGQLLRVIYRRSMAKKANFREREEQTGRFLKK